MLTEKRALDMSCSQLHRKSGIFLVLCLLRLCPGTIHNLRRRKRDNLFRYHAFHAFFQAADAEVHVSFQVENLTDC